LHLAKLAPEHDVSDHRAYLAAFEELVEELSQLRTDRAVDHVCGPSSRPIPFYRRTDWQNAGSVRRCDPHGVKIQIMRRDTEVTLSATSDEQGRFVFQILAPENFDPLQLDDINISVAETLQFELRLRLAIVAQHVEVRSELSMVQTEDSALGRVVYGAAITGLIFCLVHHTRPAAKSLHDR
jgi:hypothetical protein